MAMNLENKRQLAIILLAVGLGLVAAILTGNHIQQSIQTETGRLSAEFENKKVKPLMQEIAAMRNEMKVLAKRQATVAQQSPQDVKPAAPSVPKSSLALRTPAGRRAYTVRVDSLSAVGGLINPGDYVDILAHLNMKDPTTNENALVSSIIFQNIQILAVGTNLQAPGGYERQQSARALNITLALTPEESGLMSFVEKNGKLQLFLRAPAETETEVIQVSSWSTLADYVFETQGTELAVPRGQAKIEPVETQKEEVKPFIQIYRGGREL